MIREARIEDCDYIKQLFKDGLGYDCDSDLVRKKLSSIDHERESVLVAVIDDVVVGFVHVEKYELLYAPAMANILGIAVSQDYRRQGIGQTLLFAAEEWAKSHHINTMRLNSGRKRKEAHMFYRKLGYNNEKEQLRFTKEL